MSDPKNNILKVRISDELKESLEAEASIKGISFSEAVRERLVGQRSELVQQEIPANCIEVSEKRYKTLVEEATECDLSVGELLEEKLEFNEDELDDLCRAYGLKKDVLIKNIGFLIKSEKIQFKDGKMVWNPFNMTDEFFSIDDKIELMKISEREKQKVRQTVADNLDRIAGNDYTGNGGGL